MDVPSIGPSTAPPVAPSIASIRASLFFARSIRAAADLATLLDVLCSDDDLAPRRWGPAVGVHDPFDRAAVLAHAASSADDDFRLRLHRVAPLAVEIEAFVGPAGLGVVTVEIRGRIDAEAAERLFAAIDRTATCLPLEFGGVDVRFEVQPTATHLLAGGGVHVGTYVKWGPPTPLARTYFGARVVALVGGPTVFEHCGGVVRDAGGVTIVDLVDAPWTSDAVALKRAQARVDRSLRLLGILARPAGTARTIAGPRWLPPAAPEG